MPPDNKPLYPGHRTIRMHEFDYAGLKVIGEERILVNGGVDFSKKPVWIEGPHFIKRNGWYYLYAAEGCTSVNHSQVVFRSRSVKGPFVPYEHNHILTQRDLLPDRKHPVTSAGHAQFVEGPDGNTYAIFLAVRPYAGDFYNTGRETFWAPVTWKDDWPVVDLNGKEIRYYYNMPYAEVKQKDTRPQSGNFEYEMLFHKELDPSMLFLRTCDSCRFRLDQNTGLILKLAPETCMEHGHASFIGKRQQHLFCQTETEVTFSSNADNEKAGLIIFQDEKHFYYLCKSTEHGKPVVQLYKSNSESEGMDLLTQATLHDDFSSVKLRIDARGNFYDFYFSSKSRHWTLLKDNLDASFLSTRVAGGFIGCVFAMYATSSGKQTTNQASFKSLYYRGNDPMYK